jgi:hypothetical protein
MLYFIACSDHGVPFALIDSQILLVYLAWQKLVANQAGSECNNIQKLLK